MKTFYNLDILVIHIIFVTYFTFQWNYLTVHVRMIKQMSYVNLNLIVKFRAFVGVMNLNLKYQPISLGGRSRFCCRNTERLAENF